MYNLENSPAALRGYAFVKFGLRCRRILIFIGFKRGNNYDPWNRKKVT